MTSPEQAVLTYFSTFKGTHVRLGTVTLQRAPKTGRNPGCVYICHYGGGYIGKICTDGVYRGCEVTEQQGDDLNEFAERGNYYVAEVGRARGICGFCGHPLDDPESVRYGYGPVCARKHGLPHANRHGF